ncbi:MAG: hypothetical protein IJI58_03625 [Bacilli bacterium]|nr:hypothetical protein [Bacilli bacterium]
MKKTSNIKSINEINREIIDAKRSGKNIMNISDGSYTFDEYVDIRNHLFIALCNAYPDISWKYKIEDSRQNNNFVAGINSPDGVITFQLDMEYWNELKVIDLSIMPNLATYNVDDVKVRLKSLKEKNHECR